MIILICGLPGVGKTTLARNLACQIKATVLSSDEIRKSLFPNPTYSQFERKLVYDVLLLAARYLNKAKVDCILDATFNRESSRMQVKNKLKLQNKQFLIIECFCPEEIVIQRLESRKDDYSDATLEIYQRMKKIYEPVKGNHVLVDTRINPKVNAKKIKKLLR